MTLLELLLQLKTKLMELAGLKKSRLENWALGIQKSEGWSKTSRSFHNCNPGNLRFAGQAGATGKDEKGFAVFRTYELGFFALMRQLDLATTGNSKVYSCDMTLKEFTMKYTDLKEGIELENYLSNITGRLAVSENIKIKDIV